MDDPSGFNNVIWIYWFQSVIIGLFNFMDIMSIERSDNKDAALANTTAESNSKGCLAWFFLMHYGIFHLVYFVFLTVSYASGTQLKVVLLGVAAFLLEATMSFIRRRPAIKSGSLPAGILFIVPYLRVVPMHLTILAPSFFGWAPSMLFIVLKTIADILFYIITQRLVARRASPAEG